MPYRTPGEVTPNMEKNKFWTANKIVVASFLTTFTLFAVCLFVAAAVPKNTAHFDFGDAFGVLAVLMCLLCVVSGIGVIGIIARKLDEE